MQGRVTPRGSSRRPSQSTYRSRAPSVANQVQEDARSSARCPSISHERPQTRFPDPNHAPPSTYRESGPGNYPPSSFRGNGASSHRPSKDRLEYKTVHAMEWFADRPAGSTARARDANQSVRRSDINDLDRFSQLSLRPEDSASQILNRRGTEISRILSQASGRSCGLSMMSQARTMVPFQHEMPPTLSIKQTRKRGRFRNTVNDSKQEKSGSKHDVLPSWRRHDLLSTNTKREK